MKKEVRVVNPSEVLGAVYFLPAPKSPHCCDLEPTREHIVGNGN
jgi:nitrous-oxide reductase